MFECSEAGWKVRFPDESSVFPVESFQPSLLGFDLNPGIRLTRNDRSEQDLDCYNEGNGHGARTDKRELGHR